MGGMAVPDLEKFHFSPAVSDLGQGWKVNPFALLLVNAFS